MKQQKSGNYFGYIRIRDIIDLFENKMIITYNFLIACLKINSC